MSTSLAAATDKQINALSVRKASNLSPLWDAMEVYYIDGLDLPLGFSALKSDMKSTAGDLQQDWFPHYMELHFALTSSMCRKTFTMEAQFLEKLHDLSFHSKMGSFLAKPLSQSHGDWRVKIRNSRDCILNGVYWHGINLQEHGLEEFAKTIENGNYHLVPIEAYCKVRKNTFGGILLYKRNLIEHFADHFKKEVNAKGLTGAQIKDNDEVELFASKSLPFTEPSILRFVMENKVEV